MPVKSVDAALTLNDSVAYIKINRFTESTAREFKLETKKIQKNIPHIILDLRDNGGGYMNPAIEIANQFLDKGLIIVKTVNKKGEEKITLSSSKGKFITSKLYVLINENTASASEIIAGAIQDNDRGTIIGRRSFGKGLVQREISLKDGSIVKLTVARYYTPSGRSIQKPYENAFAENKNFEKGLIRGKDSLSIPDALKYKTLKGRTVYGGGGIVPDVFIEKKNGNTEEAIVLLMKTSLVSYFVFEEIEKNRAFLEKLSYSELILEISTNPIYYEHLKSHLVAAGLEFNLDKHREAILQNLIAEYIYQLRSNEEMYLWNILNDTVLDQIPYQTTE